MSTDSMCCCSNWTIEYWPEQQESICIFMELFAGNNEKWKNEIAQQRRLKETASKMKNISDKWTSCSVVTISTMESSANERDTCFKTSDRRKTKETTKWRTRRNADSVQHNMCKMSARSIASSEIKGEKRSRSSKGREKCEEVKNERHECLSSTAR